MKVKPLFSLNKSPIFWVLLYFVFMFLYRSLFPRALSYDESILYIQSQNFLSGYGDQAPFYRWLVRAFTLVFQNPVIAMTLVKNLVLFGAAVAIVCIAKPLKLSKLSQMFSISSLFLIYDFIYEYQRDKGNSIIILCLSLWSFFYLFRLRQNKQLLDAIIFSLLLATGLLSKYNFIFTVFLFFIIILWDKSLRQLILKPKMYIALIPAIVLLLPHAFYLVDNLSQAGSASLDKLQSNDLSYLTFIPYSTFMTFLYVFISLGSLFLFSFFSNPRFFLKQLLPASQGLSDFFKLESGLYLKLIILIFCVPLPFIYLSSVLHFESRYFLHISIFLILIFLVFVEKSGLLNSPSFAALVKNQTKVAAVLALLIPSIFLLDFFKSHYSEDYKDLSINYQAYAHELKKIEGFPEKPVVYSFNRKYAANFAYRLDAAFADSRDLKQIDLLSDKTREEILSQSDGFVLISHAKRKGEFNKLSKEVFNRDFPKTNIDVSAHLIGNKNRTKTFWLAYGKWQD